MILPSIELCEVDGHDGVGPVDNRYPPTSPTTVSIKKKEKKETDTSHLTHDTGHVALAVWYLTGDT